MANPDAPVDLQCWANEGYAYQTWQIFNVLNLILEAQVGGGLAIVTAPSGGDPFTDFSMFPGGTLPVTGKYIAFDSNYTWTLDAAIDTTWQQTPRSS